MRNLKKRDRETERKREREKERQIDRIRKRDITHPRVSMAHVTLSSSHCSILVRRFSASCPLSTSMAARPDGPIPAWRAKDLCSAEIDMPLLKSRMRRVSLRGMLLKKVYHIPLDQTGLQNNPRGFRVVIL